MSSHGPKVRPLRSACVGWLTTDSVESAEAMRENIVGNADGQRFVGIELIGVRVLEVSASAVATD